MISFEKYHEDVYPRYFTTIQKYISQSDKLSE